MPLTRPTIETSPDVNVISGKVTLQMKKSIAMMGKKFHQVGMARAVHLCMVEGSSHDGKCFNVEKMMVFAENLISRKHSMGVMT